MNHHAVGIVPVLLMASPTQNTVIFKLLRASLCAKHYLHSHCYALCLECLRYRCVRVVQTKEILCLKHWSDTLIHFAVYWICINCECNCEAWVRTANYVEHFMLNM